MANLKAQPKTKGGGSSGRQGTPADTLAKTTKKSAIELKEKELDQISGGCATGEHFPKGT